MKTSHAFEEWFRENKNSNELRDGYDNYKLALKQMGEKPVSFKKWALGEYQED
jgi:hypothetical protein